MIVLDASALVELLLTTDRGRALADRLGDPTVTLHGPHVIDLEVAQVIRRYVASGSISPESGRTAITELRELDLVRYPHEPLLERIWGLRDSLTAYDAAYVALAEALGARLITCDAALSRAPASDATVEVLP